MIEKSNKRNNQLDKTYNNTDYEALVNSFISSAKSTQNLPAKADSKDIILENVFDYVFDFRKKHPNVAVALYVFPSKENLSVVAFDVFLITSCKISALISSEATAISNLFSLYENDSDFTIYKYTLKTIEKKNSTKQVYMHIVSLTKKYEKLHNASFKILDCCVNYKFN